MTLGVEVDAEPIAAAVQATATSRAWTAAPAHSVTHLGDPRSTTVDLS